MGTLQCSCATPDFMKTSYFCEVTFSFDLAHFWDFLGGEWGLQYDTIFFFKF